MARTIAELRGRSVSTSNLSEFLRGIAVRRAWGRLAIVAGLRSIPVAVAVVFLGACAADQTVDTAFDPCSQLRITVSSDADPADAKVVDAAMQMWSHVLAVQYELVDDDGTADVLRVHFLAGDSFFRAIYWDNIGKVEVSRDRLAPENYPIALAHELGHSFGLLHVDAKARPSVMNVGNLTVEPTSEDAAQVRARWAACRN